MKRRLTFVIDVDDNHCLLGGRCPHVLSTRFGSEWVCGLFRDELGDPISLSEDGHRCLLRCQQCKDAEGDRG